MTVQTPPHTQPFLASALDGLADGVLMFAPSGNLTYWNSAAAHLLEGLEDVLEQGASLSALAAAGQQRGIVSYWPLSVRGPFVETEIRRADGRWLRLRGGGADNGGGRSFTLADITAIKLRENCAIEGEQRYRALTAAVVDWVWEADQTLRIVELTDGTHDFSGGAFRELFGRELIELFEHSQAADGDVMLARLACRGSFRHASGAFIDRGGRLRHLRLTGVPLFTSAGEFTGYRGTAIDITDQIEAEAQEQRARVRLVDAIDNLSDGFALFDEHDRLVLCNERFKAAMPGSADRLVPGITFEEAVMAVRSVGEDGLTVQQLEAWVAERLDGRLSLSYEQRLSDGRWFLVKDLKIEGGAKVLTLTDITQLKRREKALRESEARFRAVFNHAAIGIAVIEPGGRIADANQAFASMFQMPPGAIATENYADLVHPDWRDSDVPQARQMIAGDIDQYTTEKRYLRRNGAPFWGRLTASLVRSDGTDGSKFAIAMIEDVDERKKADQDLQMFRAVVEASNEAIAIYAPGESQAIYGNPAHRRLFGDVRSVASWRDSYLPESQIVIDREIVPALRRGDSWEGVLAAQAADGRCFPLWQRAGAVTGSNGRPSCYFAFMHDHTPQRQVEDELCRAKEIAEEANLAKTRFLAAASHDLRQPMQALAMFVEVLSTHNSDPHAARLIGKIQDSLGAVETLLNGLLDVSKLEAGLVVPAISDFPLQPTFNRLAAEFEPLAGAENLSLRMVPTSASISSDPALLERVLRNLLNNAIRYTETGRVMFGCRRRGDRLRIEVWDTGIGIPKAQQKLIFREFHQLGNPQRDRRQGLGLGLAIVERLVNLLGHPITVESEPGKGSVFAVEVPLATGKPKPEQQQLNLGMARTGASIVVIDDEPDVLESMRLVLESWGHHVLTAPDCDVALRALADEKRVPDLIIADYRLQHGFTGGQAIARIRVRLKAPIPAIIVTGDTAPERLRHAQANGHGLLHKPVQPDTLRSAIDSALARLPAVRVGARTDRAIRQTA